MISWCHNILISFDDQNCCFNCLALSLTVCWAGPNVVIVDLGLKGLTGKGGASREHLSLSMGASSYV